MSFSVCKSIDFIFDTWTISWSNALYTTLANALVPGGVILAYVATTTQLSRFAEALKESDLFTEPESSEIIVRGWHHEGLAVRPQHRMIGHTGFLTIARRMAPGVSVLQRRRRPSKGSYGVAE